MRIALLLAALAAIPGALLSQSRADTVQARRDTARTLEAVTVTAIRARDDAPVSATTIDEAELERRSFGQDIPLVLQGTPSLTSYSEAGNYWGYSYIRMRGIDQSRINLTLDGIPLNDPEDQVLYFADFPDLANSISSIQVQRGVGASAPGTASYGGSINFQTIPVATTRRTGQLQLQGGSFGTARASLEYATGLTPSRFAAYARVSALQSRGFRNHSGMEGRSGFLSVAYVGDRQIVKFTALAGLFADTLAYVGATASDLARDRRFNPLRPDEVDRFGEQVASLSYTRHLGERASASATLYRISAAGNYDVCIDRCDQPTGDLWNFNLDFAWYGATTAWTFETRRLRVSTGANANTYARDHYAYARPDFSQPLYFNTGHKEDASVFAKVAYDVGPSPLTLFGDVQLRRAGFRYAPDANAGIQERDIGWTFLNPKVGATLHLTPKLRAYASYGVNSREPARSDMLAGFDNLDTSNVAFVGPFSRVRPERAHDVEAGVHYRGVRHPVEGRAGAWTLDANVFAMDFRNEILPVGQLTAIGTPLRTNVRASWRRGVEAEVTARPADVLTIGVSATLMRGRIADFTDDETGRSYHGVEPLLTPRFTSTQRVTVDLTRALSLTIIGRGSSRSHLTNTGDRAFALPGDFTADASVDWKRGSHGLSLFVNNATNSRGYASGHVSFGEARYYVVPPVNAFLVARIGM
jgi:iron complex outermembrane receptor protein